ncbi:hypothetical protein [Streptomyces shenzhenensis]|uniref:hypothetical protein n=1 Tax=Streptomyces shenzhenensis TaxID=943815 RepID=UPI003F5418EA
MTSPSTERVETPCTYASITTVNNARPVRRRRSGSDEDVACLSPFVRHHINMHGRYSFQLPGGLRRLREPDAAEDE